MQSRDVRRVLIVLSSHLVNPPSPFLCQPRFKVPQRHLELLPQPRCFLLDLLVDTINLPVELNFILIASINESTNAFIKNLVLFYFIIKLFLELMQMLLIIVATCVLIMCLGLLCQVHLKTSLVECMLNDV